MNISDEINELKSFTNLYGNKIKISRITRIPQVTLRKFCRGESDPRLSTILLILDAKNQIEKGEQNR